MREAPPREIGERDQPELFAMLRTVAARVGVPLPARVQLFADVNASISPGALGLGLGLLSLHTVSELGAAVAHELGHGPRPAGVAKVALRALAGLAEHLARRRELRADEAALRAAGRDVHLAALERAGRGAALFDAFVQDEVAPILRCGRRPDNLYDGFRAYLAELSEAAGGVPGLPASRDGGTHPTLAVRLEHARALPAPATPPLPRDDRPARSLLANPERLERERSAALAAALAPGVRLAPVGWLDVADVVWAPRLAEEGRVLAVRLAAHRGCAPTARAALAALVRGLEAGDDDPLACAVEPALAVMPELDRGGAADGVLARALGALLGCALLERGWRWRSEVGRALEVACGPASLEPFVEAREALRDRTRLALLLERAGAAA